MAIQTIQYLADKLMNADDAKALAESIGSVSESKAGTNAYTVAPNNDEFERFLVERNRKNNEPTSISLFPTEDLTLGTLKKHLSGYKESPPKRPGASRQATFVVDGKPYRVRIFVAVDNFDEGTPVKSLRLHREKALAES